MVYTPPLSAGGRRGWRCGEVCGVELNLLPNFQKGGINSTSVLRGEFLGQRGGTNFRRVEQFLHKKLKPEIFNDKKSL